MLLSSILFFVLASCLFSSSLALPKSDADAIVRHYSLEISDQTIWATCQPFGSATVFNASMPGPTLRARAGEILQVRVWNHSQRNTTVHFHGLSMRMHPIMDGTVMVSQWPITPGSYFDYRIPLTREDMGTYFYHSHVGLQAMSAYGVLVVEDPDPQLSEEQVDHIAQYQGKTKRRDGTQGLSPVGKSQAGSPFNYDEDRILAMGDYFTNTNQDIIGQGLEADPFKWPGSASALLLNGQSSPSTPAVACNQTAADTVGVQCSAAPPDCAASFPTIRVNYGKTYRFRFVGATALMYTSVGILNAASTGLQKLTLIEADGTYLNPLEVDHVELTSGQRYSALYRSKTKRETLQDGSNGVYWIRIESRWRKGPSMWAKLVHEDPIGLPTPDKLPPVLAQSLLPNETFGWLTSQFSPRKGWSSPMPSDASVTRTVVINTQQIPFWNSKKGVRWAENSALYSETNSTAVPYLVKTFVGMVPVPGYDRAFAADNPWNAQPVLKDLVANSTEESELAKKHHLLQGYDDFSNVYLAKPGEVIDIVLINKPSALSQNVEIHPWHMHSKKHWTRTIQPGTFSFKKLDSLYGATPTGEYADPIRRDTTIVYASPGAAYLTQTVADPANNDGGWAVLRYKVDSNNAGVFILHCHLAFHLSMGMATVWAIAPDQLLDQAKAYAPQQDTIEGVSGYLQYGGNVTAV